MVLSASLWKCDCKNKAVGDLQQKGEGMKLKGEMVIELTDANTGEVETISETNMVTNAVNNILGVNPVAAWMKTGDEYANMLLWNGNLLPICPNMIGGILLFPKTLTVERQIVPGKSRMLNRLQMAG